MNSIKEILKPLRKKGASFFNQKDLDLFISEIGKSYSSPIYSFEALVQEDETVRLEFSFLTSKAIFDYALVNSSIEVNILFLKNISNIVEEISTSSTIIQILNTGRIGLIYRAYNIDDKIELNKYKENIIDQINNL